MTALDARTAAQPEKIWYFEWLRVIACMAVGILMLGDYMPWAWLPTSPFEAAWASVPLPPVVFELVTFFMVFAAAFALAFCLKRVPILGRYM